MPVAYFCVPSGASPLYLLQLHQQLEGQLGGALPLEVEEPQASTLQPGMSRQQTQGSAHQPQQGGPQLAAATGAPVMRFGTEPLAGMVALWLTQH